MSTYLLIYWSKTDKRLRPLTSRSADWSESDNKERYLNCFFPPSFELTTYREWYMGTLDLWPHLQGQIRSNFQKMSLKPYKTNCYPSLTLCAIKQNICHATLIWFSLHYKQYMNMNVNNIQDYYCYKIQSCSESELPCTLSASCFELVCVRIVWLCFAFLTADPESALTWTCNVHAMEAICQGDTVTLRLHVSSGSAAVQWLKEHGSWGLSVWSWRVLSVPAWVSSSALVFSSLLA